jgi:acyl-coenzyme A synthetase/AMP-(fatty) acid ligase
VSAVRDGAPPPAPTESERHASGRPAADHALAAVLHTSGSTGTPKPVPIAWAGLDAFTAWTNTLLDLGPADRVLRVAELVFDLAWFDHLATWRAGATLCLMSRRDLTSGAALKAAIGALQPTVIYGVPSMFMKLCAALSPGEALPASVRAILFAGEVFPPRELALLAERAPHAALYNFFGPTETNVCTFHPVRRDALDGTSEVPIGRPCPFAACRLVDDSGATIEGAGTGELVVSGPTTVGGGPYATRDRVQRDAEGTLWFRGRIDRMVKVRGYRVEPGEVEAALAKHPEVRAAAVIVAPDPRLGNTLRAAVTVRPGGALAVLPAGDPTAERALRGYLAERLPPYMVPERVHVLEELPLTTTGKIDYSALAEAR